MTYHGVEFIDRYINRTEKVAEQIRFRNVDASGKEVEPETYCFYHHRPWHNGIRVSFNYWGDFGCRSYRGRSDENVVFRVLFAAAMAVIFGYAVHKFSELKDHLDQKQEEEKDIRSFSDKFTGYKQANPSDPCNKHIDAVIDSHRRIIRDMASKTWRDIVITSAMVALPILGFAGAIIASEAFMMTAFIGLVTTVVVKAINELYNSSTKFIDTQAKIIDSELSKIDALSNNKPARKTIEAKLDDKKYQIPVYVFTRIPAYYTPAYDAYYF